MTDPRSLAAGNAAWLTDSRVYNLIWLGRWLERAEAITRAVNSAARQTAASSTGPMGLRDALVPVAHMAGMQVDQKETLAADILLHDTTASALHCLTNARMNATQVAPVELIRAIAAAILDLQETDASSLETPEQLLAITEGISNHLAQINTTIEDQWFSRESLTEEEVLHRFVQQ